MEGEELLFPHHPPLPLADARPAPGTLLPQDSAAQALNGHARGSGDPGWEAEGGSGGSSGEAPAPAPPERPARQTGGSLGGAPRPTRLGHRAPDCEGGVSRLLFLGPSSLARRSPGCERDVQALGEAAGRRCGCSDPSQFSQLNTKGRRRNVQSLPAEGAARPRRSPRLGWHPGGRRPRGGGGLSQEESGGGRKGETGRLRRQREARRGPGLPSYPDSSPGLERKARTQISSGLAAFSVFFFFFPRAPFPHPDVPHSQGEDCVGV